MVRPSRHLAPRRLLSAARAPGGIAVLAGLVVVVLRAQFVGDAAYADEGGLLVVAREWHTGGRYLYGSLFVDRPPLLLAFFRLADALGGVEALRVLGLALAFASVLLAARAGLLLGGGRGSAAAAFVTTALLADPRLGIHEIDAETVGLPLVLLAAVLALEGIRRVPARAATWWLLAAGASGASALLVKQNLADGLVFAAVLALGQGLRRLAWVGLGAGAVAILAALWSTTSTGAHGLWYAMYGFRMAAGSQLFGRVSGSQLDRLHDLVHAAILSGLLVVVIVALVVNLTRRPDTVTLAVVAMLAVEVLGVAGGGYYWTHYLVGVIPATALLAARAVTHARLSWLVGLVIGATVVSTVHGFAGSVAGRTPAADSELGRLGSWFDAHARPGDSAVVLYGKASLFEATSLRPAYPYLWTLPQRVLDPHMNRLVRTLARPDGATYVVVRMPLDPWGQDPRGRLPRALRAHYHRAAEVDGNVIYVRDTARQGDGD